MYSLTYGSPRRRINNEKKKKKKEDAQGRQIGDGRRWRGLRIDASGGHIPDDGGSVSIGGICDDS